MHKKVLVDMIVKEVTGRWYNKVVKDVISYYQYRAILPCILFLTMAFVVGTTRWGGSNLDKGICCTMW
jgi:hypothetical protein